MKEYINHSAKYQDLANKVAVYEHNTIPIINKQIDKLELAKAQKLRRKQEILNKIEMYTKMLSHMKEDYDQDELKIKSAKVTNTPLPKMWRKA